MNAQIIEEIKKQLNDGKKLSVICKDLGLNYKNTCYKLNTLNIYSTNFVKSKVPKNKINKIKSWISDGLTFLQIARKLKVHSNTLRIFCKNNGISKPATPALDLALIMELRDQGMSQQDIADKFQSSQPVISRVLQEAGVQACNRGADREAVYIEYGRQNRIAATAAHKELGLKCVEMHKTGMKQSEIGEILGLKQWDVSRLMSLVNCRCSYHKYQPTPYDYEVGKKALELRASGMNLNKIAKELGFSNNTIRAKIKLVQDNK